MSAEVQESGGKNGKGKQKKFAVLLALLMVRASILI